MSFSFQAMKRSRWSPEEPADLGDAPEEVQHQLEVIEHAVNNFSQRTGVTLRSLKPRTLKPDVITPAMLAAWKSEQVTPTQPPPSNITHKFKFLKEIPPLHDLDWDPQRFIK